jgi:E3 ubiquitin-protein ligase RNF13
VGSIFFDVGNEFGCDKFTLPGNGENKESPIILVKRGKCSFTMKVRNIEHAGGKLGIIVDEVDNEQMDSIIMVDDGTGNGIRIPSIMINKKEGEIVIDYYKKASDQEKK